MSRAPFTFTPQFALDRARITRDGCERALAAAKRASNDAQRLLAGLITRQTELETSVQHARIVLAALGVGVGQSQAGSVWGDERAAAREQVDALRRQRDRHQSVLAAKVQHASYAASRLEEERQALELAMGVVKTLESMREARLRDFEVRLMRATQREADDVAVEAWRRGQT